MIYFVIPDMFKPQFEVRAFCRSIIKGEFIYYLKNKVFPRHVPVGGIKILYQHCLLLKQLGIEAELLRMGEYEGNYFGYDLKPLPFGSVIGKLKPDDVVVIPEIVPYLSSMFSCRKIMFVQNWINIDNRFSEEDVHKNYLDLGYDEVLACGSYVKSKIKEKMSLEAHLVTNGIDLNVFKPNRSVRIKNRVMCLPRKNASDLKLIKSLVINKLGGEVEFVPVHNVSEERISEEYRKADIFLATGYPEGFSLPPLEAMASGAVVVGFTGGAGQEFMIHGTSALVASDGDCEAAANLIIRLIGDESLKEHIREGGLEMSKRYSLERMKEQVHNYYSRVVA